jgi:hypothetical protein
MPGRDRLQLVRNKSFHDHEQIEKSRLPYKIHTLDHSLQDPVLMVQNFQRDHRRAMKWMVMPSCCGTSQLKIILKAEGAIIAAPYATSISLSKQDSSEKMFKRSRAQQSTRHR